MKHLFTSVFAVLLMAGAYIWTFGAPAQLVAVAPFLSTFAQGEGGEGASSQRPQRGGGRATAVVMEALEHRPYTATIQTIGTARAWRSTDVLAETSGRITEVLMEPNKRVAQGDVLVRLDNRTEQLTLANAIAREAQEQSVVERYDRLLATGNLTITDVTISEARLALSEAEIEVGLAEVALDRRTIRAPFEGTLGLNDVEVGDLLSVSDFIVRVDDSQTLVIEFELPERAISMLSLGRKVVASTPSYAGRVFEAEISAFDNRLDSTTRSISVEARIDNTDGLLWAGMTFAVRLLNDTEPMAVVPATALNWTREGAGIWMIAEGKATRRPIAIRFRRGGDVWIETDVPIGAQIVVEGAAKLREGSAVAPVGDGNGASDSANVIGATLRKSDTAELDAKQSASAQKDPA